MLKTRLGNFFKLEELKLYKTNSLHLGNIFKSNWGYSSMYPGTFPTDWVKPSGMEKDGYCKNVPKMLTSMDILESGKLKNLEITREYDLLNRSINYMNHCSTHKCSNYCLVITIITVLYNMISHKHIKDADIVTANSKSYAKLKIAKCRMDYGKARIFYSSGEIFFQEVFLFICFQKLYAIQTVNFVITVEEIIQEYL